MPEVRLVFHPDAFATRCDVRGRWMTRHSDGPWELMYPERTLEEQYASVLWYSRVTWGRR